MKKLAFALALISISQIASAMNLNQDIADSILKNSEIQKVVQAIAKSRGLVCASPGDEEVAVKKASSFEAIFNCNAPFDFETGVGGADVQIVTVKGVYYTEGRLKTKMNGLKIIAGE